MEDLKLPLEGLTKNFKDLDLSNLPSVKDFNAGGVRAPLVFDVDNWVEAGKPLNQNECAALIIPCETDSDCEDCDKVQRTDRYRCLQRQEDDNTFLAKIIPYEKICAPNSWDDGNGFLLERTEVQPQDLGRADTSRAFQQTYLRLGPCYLGGVGDDWCPGESKCMSPDPADVLFGGRGLSPVPGGCLYPAGVQGDCPTCDGEKENCEYEKVTAKLEGEDTTYCRSKIYIDEEEDQSGEAQIKQTQGERVCGDLLNSEACEGAEAYTQGNCCGAGEARFLCTPSSKAVFDILTFCGVMTGKGGMLPGEKDSEATKKMFEMTSRDLICAPEGTFASPAFFGDDGIDIGAGKVAPEVVKLCAVLGYKA
uniref:Uncharacterized protein n=1 Tax=Chromera velia CCMP2878 TaxID=1169474 RepID=A0A0G4IGA0_9ALVE|eukprot:Cvel_14176.t1-p1 / transcript=Cvel_14176.t1 / gene=Cvel_14176 / organism=Chromera_velia_CCMP2878 / gene_product=hypothetical protein / transcript_product=hypothetical protein / location=Cvel_scaffold999:35056-37002(+) / protein_length=364 / sequence_SO=supercontig / SO=protein_coding / is_pseudo=false